MANSTALEIKRLKEELGEKVCVMGHHYQHDEIAEHCDVMGDSLELARKIKDVKAEHIVFCGVYFMGETAALLAAPEQKIHLPEPDADCMMSLMASAKLARSVLEELSRDGRKIIPLAYVNTMLELKEVVGEYGGAVCTSANSEKLMRWALSQGDGVLFLPDRHLGRNTAKKLGISEKDQYTLRLNGKGLRPGQAEGIQAKLLFWPGSCAVHAKLQPALVERIRQDEPQAIVMAHPECKPELINLCDGAGSTSYLIKEAERLARERPGRLVYIGTEENLVGRLAKKYKGILAVKPLGPAFCPHMQKVTPEKLLNKLRQITAGSARPLEIDRQGAQNAKAAIRTMLNVCAAQ